MRYLLLLVIGAIVWATVTSIPSDALGMMVGLLLGVFAGIPTALLVLATERQRAVERESAEYRRRLGATYSTNGHGIYLVGEAKE